MEVQGRSRQRTSFLRISALSERPEHSDRDLPAAWSSAQHQRLCRKAMPERRQFNSGAPSPLRLLCSQRIA